MAKNMADAFLAAVKERTGLARDEDLASRFGWGKSTISSWRLRGFIPSEHRITLEQYSGIPYDRFMQLSYTKEPIIGWIVELAFLTAFAEAISGLPPKRRNTLIIAIFSRVAQLRETVAQRVVKSVGSRDLMEAYSDLSTSAMSGAFLKGAEIRALAEGKTPGPEVPQ